MSNSNTQNSATPLQKSTAPQSRVMSDLLRPTMCIRRNELIYVPLIAVDELPDSVRLIGVPTTMTQNEMVEAGMSFKGEFVGHGKLYQLEPSEKDIGSETSGYSQSSEGSATPPRKAFTAPDMKAGAGSATGKREGAGEQMKPDVVQANIANITANPSDIPYPSRAVATPGTLGKKVYCTYFLNTGNCNYMQEGCKYKHEFPDDDETRASIGLRKFPTWMRDDPAVPIKPLAALPLHATAPAYQSPSWRSRSGSQPPQAELAGGIKPLNQSPFSPVANTGSCSTQPQNTVRAQSPAPSMQPQNSNYNNQAQQVPFFAPPQPYFPNHASHNPQQQSRPFSGAFGKGNGHGHNSQIPVDPFNRRMPTHTANGSYNSPVGSVIHPRRASPPTQAPIGRPVANVQSFATDTRVNGQQQTSGNGYNHAAPDARARNAPVYTPTHTSSSQDLQNGATTPVANVDGIASGNNNHNTQAHHFGNTNSNGNGSAPANFDFRAPTPATSSINGNAPTEFNGGQPLMSNDIHQLNINTQPLTPTTLNNNAPGNFDGNVDVDANGSGIHAKQSDVSQATPNSPAYLHRRMFIPEGEPRYVANPVKDVHQKGRGFKKHGSSSGKHAHKGGRATLSETLI